MKIFFPCSFQNQRYAKKILALEVAIGIPKCWHHDPKTWAWDPESVERLPFEMLCHAFGILYV